MDETLYEVVSFDSYNSLHEAGEKEKFNVFGIADECNNKYEAIALPNGCFVCGFMYYDHGMKPQIIFQNDNPLLLLGFDKRVIYLNYLTKQTLVEKECLSLFYEFIEVRSCNLIIAVSELDVCAVDYNGKIIWSAGFRDVVEDYHRLHDDKLFVKCADGSELVLSIVDGSLG